MDVKEAVSVAKSYLIDLYLGEEITNVGLEEVEFDDVSNKWSVTLGFNRPWDRHAFDALTRVNGRSYKVVRINDVDRRVVSLKDRIIEGAK